MFKPFKCPPLPSTLSVTDSFLERLVLISQERAVSHLLGLPRGSRFFEEDVLLGSICSTACLSRGLLNCLIPCGPFHSLITVINIEHLCATASGCLREEQQALEVGEREAIRYGTILTAFM